jgi:hypothetical protein
MSAELRTALVIELAYCRHMDMSVSETAKRIADRFFDPPKHRYWGAGEADCPREIKAGNGELHTLRCKSCNVDNPRDDRCFGEARTGVA